MKAPEDRRPKAEESDDLKVTCRGQEWTIAKDALDDWELMDDLGRADAGNPAFMASALRRLLGPQQTVAAMNLLRDKKTGRVSLESGGEFAQELFLALNPNG